MKTTFHLMRHAHADYSKPAEWNTKGWGYDLAPLSKKGIEESKAVVNLVRVINPDYIICSPATRALETATHIIRELGTRFSIEFDLHEWVPDHSFEWRGIEDVEKLERDFNSKNGVHTVGAPECWESYKFMKDRMDRTLRKYQNYPKVLVVCHSLLMKSIYGNDSIDHTDIVEYQL